MSGSSGTTKVSVDEQGTFSGMIYSLGSPANEHTTSERLSDQLADQEVKLDLMPDGYDSEQQQIIIPDEFQTSGNPDVADFRNVSTFSTPSTTGVIGLVEYNDPQKVRFQGKEFLVFESETKRFCIFKIDQEYFLLIVGNRDIYEPIKDIIDIEISKIGLKANDVSITKTGFESIRETLVDYLKQTKLTDFSNPRIQSKSIVGRGYGDDPAYTQEAEKGTVSNHQFGTKQVGVEETEKTVQITNDGLVRCYNKITFREYIDMVAGHVVPNTNQQVQTSVYSHTAKDSAPESQD